MSKSESMVEMEANLIRAIRHMATPSLNPDDFAELDRVLARLAYNRHLTREEPEGKREHHLLKVLELLDSIMNYTPIDGFKKEQQLSLLREQRNEIKQAIAKAKGE